MRSTHHRLSGFTLVELVVVIILLSIISVYAASRYAGVSGFSAFAAQDQALSIIRQIQLSRMQSNVTGNLSSDYRLTVSESCLGSVASCNGSDVRSNKVELPDNIRFTPTMTIDFDLLGNPLCASSSCPSDFKISLSNASETLAVCINEQGYVYGC